VGSGIQTVTEKILDVRAAKLFRRQADVVNHQQ